MKRLVLWFLLGPTAVLLCAAVPLATYSMSSDSMMPTIQAGDIVGGDTLKGVCGLARPAPGKVIFHRRGGEVWVSRVVAGPGQTVQMTRGKLVIDGTPVKTRPEGVMKVGPRADVPIVRETLGNGTTYLTLNITPDGELDDTQAFRVAAGSWFVMGDNRDNSADSRVLGPVAQKDVCGVGTSILRARDRNRVGQLL